MIRFKIPSYDNKFGFSDLGDPFKYFIPTFTVFCLIIECNGSWGMSIGWVDSKLSRLRIGTPEGHFPWWLMNPSQSNQGRLIIVLSFS